MAWVVKFSGLPTLTSIPEAGDSYGAGVFSIGSGGNSRVWNSGLIPPYNAPKAYVDLGTIGASISQVLRISGRVASRSNSGFEFDFGGGLAIYGPGTDDADTIYYREFDPTLPGDGIFESHATENGTTVAVGSDPTLAQPPPHQYRIYWNGTGSAFIIPDSGFGSWSVAANTASFWTSKDDGTTWVRHGDRAIAGGVVPTRAAIWGFCEVPGGGTSTITFSNLEVAEDAPPSPGLTIIVPPSPSYNAPELQYSGEAQSVSAPPSLAYNAPVLQYAEEQATLSAPSLAYEDSSIHSETNPWVLLSIGPVVAPTLESGPTSPNARFTTKPMTWSVNGQGTLADITSLVIAGRTAVLSGVVQAGFSGTVSLNAIDSYDISITADEDFPDWQSKYELPWSLVANNGIEATFVGSIIKYVSLPYPDELTELQYTYLRNFDFPLRFEPNGDAVLTSDERGIEHNMRNSIMVLQRGIPLAASLGSRVPTLPFDPEDDALRSLIAQEAARAVSVGEPRVVLDPTLRVVDEDGTNTVKVAMPYAVRATVKWQDLLFQIPVIGTIDKSN